MKNSEAPLQVRPTIGAKMSSDSSTKLFFFTFYRLQKEDL